AVAIALDTLEVTFRPGDTEHGIRGIQGHDASRRREQVGEPAGPRSEVQHALPVPSSSHFDESAEPELAVDRLVVPNPRAVRGMSRMVGAHTTCNRRAGYQLSGGARHPA